MHESCFSLQYWKDALDVPYQCTRRIFDVFLFYFPKKVLTRPHLNFAIFLTDFLCFCDFYVDFFTCTKSFFCQKHSKSFTISIPFEINSKAFRVGEKKQQTLDHQTDSESAEC